MSKPVAAFCSAMLVVGGIVYFVHVQQQSDKDRMHQGVIRDKQRQLAKQKEKDQL